MNFLILNTHKNTKIYYKILNNHKPPNKEKLRTESKGSFIKIHKTESEVQWVKHLSCTWPTWFDHQHYIWSPWACQAEFGVILPQSREYLGLPEFKREKTPGNKMPFITLMSSKTTHQIHSWASWKVFQPQCFPRKDADTGRLFIFKYSCCLESRNQEGRSSREQQGLHPKG